MRIRASLSKRTRRISRIPILSMTVFRLSILGVGLSGDAVHLLRSGVVPRLGSYMSSTNPLIGFFLGLALLVNGALNE